MEETLNTITDIIDNYNKGAYILPESLSKAQRELACNIYYLSKFNVEAFNKWNRVVYNYQGSNAAAQVKAHEEVPELRLTRKILEAARGVSIAMNNELTIMKND